MLLLTVGLVMFTWVFHLLSNTATKILVISVKPEGCDINDKYDKQEMMFLIHIVDIRLIDFGRLGAKTHFLKLKLNLKLIIIK